MTNSYAHQAAGVERISADGYVHGLLWDIGTGKSRTVVKALERLADELDRPINVLIVAPKSVQRTWMTQFEQHCDYGFCVAVLDGPIASRLGTMSKWESPADINVAVVGYSTFAARQNKDKVLAAVKRMKPDVIVCDEGHALRGMSNTSRLLARVGRLVPRRLLLTGTPMPNGYQDLYTTWAFLDPEAWLNSDGKFMARGAWEQEYCVLGGFQGKQIVGYKNTDKLKSLIARKSSTVNKAECLDLPPTTTVVQRFLLSPAERRAYDAMVKDLLVILDDETVTAANKVVATLRLRQITSGFLPLDDGSVKEIGNTRHVMALELIENILAGENRVVVFGWSKHELDRLEQALIQQRPWGEMTAVFKINGGTAQSTRDSYLKQFGGKAESRMILLAQISTLNAGVNDLVTASNAVYLSMTHSRADFEQSKGRLDRPGQTKPVTYHVLAADNTIDTHILRAMEGKADLEASLLAHVREEATRV